LFLRLYGLWLVVQLTHLTFGPAVSHWVLGTLIGLYLVYPRIRKVRIRTDRQGIDIRWDARLPEGYVPPSAALAPPCAHPRAEPVKLSTGDCVAWLCPDCQEQLPDDFRPRTDEHQERMAEPYRLERVSRPGESPEIFRVTYATGAWVDWQDLLSYMEEEIDRKRARRAPWD
jgi:hypothetical protein